MITSKSSSDARLITGQKQLETPVGPICPGPDEEGKKHSIDSEISPSGPFFTGCMDAQYLLLLECIDIRSGFQRARAG